MRQYNYPDFKDRKACNSLPEVFKNLLKTNNDPLKKYNNMLKVFKDQWKTDHHPLQE